MFTHWFWTVAKKEVIVRVFVGVAFLGVFASFVYYLKQTSPNRYDAKLKELRKLALELPRFPGFIEETTDESSRATDAGVYKDYSSTADYEDVKIFYTKMLTPRGWQPLGETELQYWFRNVGWRHLMFKNGEFIIAIDYSGSLNRGPKYSISYVWRDTSSL